LSLGKRHDSEEHLKKAADGTEKRLLSNVEWHRTINEFNYGKVLLICKVQ